MLPQVALHPDHVDQCVTLQFTETLNGLIKERVNAERFTAHNKVINILIIIIIRLIGDTRSEDVEIHAQDRAGSFLNFFPFFSVFQ